MTQTSLTGIVLGCFFALWVLAIGRASPPSFGAPPAPVVLLLTSTDPVEVEVELNKYKGRDLYVGVPANASPEVKAVIKQHKEIVEGFWLHGDPATWDKELDVLSLQSSTSTANAFKVKK